MTEGVGLVRLSHLCLSSADLDASERFYVDLIGGKVVFEFRNDAGDRYGLFISLGKGTFLEIFKDNNEIVSSVASGFRHFCLQVQDIHYAASRFKDAGYFPHVSIGRVDRVPQFWIEDPNGIKVEFHELSDPILPQFPYC